MEGARRTEEGELAMSATMGERGGRVAPAQRSNFSPAHSNSRATYKDVLVERSEAASSEPAAGSGPTGPATEGKRGGGAAPAQRRNLSPARANGPTTRTGDDKVVARGGAFSGEPAASGDPAIPKHHSLPTHVMGPHQHTPVDYEMLTPVLSPSDWNEDKAAEEENGHILHRLKTGAGRSAPPSRSAGMWQGRPDSPPRAVQSTAERVAGAE